MTQYGYEPLSPEDSGSALLERLNGVVPALLTNHKGAARPGYVQPGMMWIDDSGATWLLSLFDGTSDVPIAAINPTTHVLTLAGVPDTYPKTAFKSDGTPDAPALYGANGELLGKKLIISGPADQQRLEFWADGVAQWIAYRDADGKFNIWGHGQGTALVIDPSNNRVNFTALPKVYGNRDVCILDADGKLPALDGSKLTNIAGAVLQTKSAVYSSTASINTAIPMDATAPQNTEGTQILSVVITPKSASSKLRARFTCPCVALFGSAGRAIAAMFFNAGADAVASSSFYGVNTGNGVLVMDKEFPSGSLSPQTISVRVGPAQAPAVVVNSVDGSTSTLGGVIATMLTVDEVMQ